MLILSGVSPASSAASIPSSTRATGKSIPFIAPKTASSSESRLTVTRRRPASASGRASARRAAPFVVRVRSSRRPSVVRRAARRSMSTGRSRRTSGSPPVIRSFSTPERRERPGGALDLLEREDLVARQERVVAAEHFLRHAVRAAEVAAVGDRDAQVVERPSESIERFHEAAYRTPRPSSGRTTTTGRDRCRYDRRCLLVPLADSTGPDHAGTMRPRPTIRGGPRTPDTDEDARDGHHGCEARIPPPLERRPDDSGVRDTSERPRTARDRHPRTRERDAPDDRRRRRRRRRVGHAATDATVRPPRARMSRRSRSLRSST